MTSPHHTISHRLVLELVGPHGPLPLEGELRYAPTDPYAVTMVFLAGPDEVVWEFGRDLLLQGVSEPAGDGDVQVFPSLDADGRAVVHIVLRAPEGQALLEARARDVLDFLGHTARAVWPGTERDHYVSTDDVIAALLVGD